MSTHTVKTDERAVDQQQLGRRVFEALRAAGLRGIRRPHVEVSRRLRVTVSLQLADAARLLELVEKPDAF